MNTLPVEMVSNIYQYLTLPKDKLKFALSHSYAFVCLDNESKRIFSILQLMYASVTDINDRIHHFISSDGLASMIITNDYCLRYHDTKSYLARNTIKFIKSKKAQVKIKDWCNEYDNKYNICGNIFNEYDHATIDRLLDAKLIK